MESTEVGQKDRVRDRRMDPGTGLWSEGWMEGQRDRGQSEEQKIEGKLTSSWAAFPPAGQPSPRCRRADSSGVWTPEAPSGYSPAARWMMAPPAPGSRYRCPGDRQAQHQDAPPHPQCWGCHTSHTLRPEGHPPSSLTVEGALHPTHSVPTAGQNSRASSWLATIAGSGLGMF